MTNPAKGQALTELRAWILANGTGLDESSFDTETRLLEGRHITSLQIPELLVEIERLAGQRIDITQLAPDDFRCLGSIAERFFR
jgi:hypothetical protein